MIRGAFIRAFVRSTEDSNRILEAIKTVFPGLDEKRMQVREHKGVYGNIFYSISYTLNRKEAKNLWKNLWDKLEPDDKQFLENHIEEFLDESGQIHLRINKQEAYKGRVVLGSSGVIKVILKLEAYPAKREKFIEAARRLVGK